MCAVSSVFLAFVFRETFDRRRFSHPIVALIVNNLKHNLSGCFGAKNTITKVQRSRLPRWKFTKLLMSHLCTSAKLKSELFPWNSWIKLNWPQKKVLNKLGRLEKKLETRWRAKRADLAQTLQKSSRFHFSWLKPNLITFDRFSDIFSFTREANSVQKGATCSYTHRYIRCMTSEMHTVGEEEVIFQRKFARGE